MEFPHIPLPGKTWEGSQLLSIPLTSLENESLCGYLYNWFIWEKERWPLLGSPSSGRVGGLPLWTPSRRRSETVLKAGEEVWPFEGLFILKVLWLLAHTALYNRTDAFSSLSNSHVSSYDWSQFPVRHEGDCIQKKKKKEWSRGLKYMFMEWHANRSGKMGFMLKDQRTPWSSSLLSL